jgi:ferric-dicitrate binding protein FerR (iron transport regulator)
MADYQYFEAGDFIQDDFFISWVLHPTTLENDFWEKWLSDHPDRKIYTDQARIVLLAIKAQPVSTPVTDGDVEDVMAYVNRHGYQPEKQRTARLISLRWGKVAAILLVVLATSLLFYTVAYKPKAPVAPQASVQWVVFKNHSEQSRIIRMADSSLAILNPHSTLKYPNTFSDTARNVFLEGEAFFEVHGNPDKAFQVHSQNMIIRVLGTSFTVRAFEKEKDFRVVVNTGKVMVYTAKKPAGSQPHSVLVLPHQQVILNRQQSELVKDTVKATMLLAKETARQAFSFYKASIPEVIGKLETAYQVKIAYDPRQFEHLTVTAALSDLPLDEKVKCICKAVDAKCSFNDGQITIEKN